MTTPVRVHTIADPALGNSSYLIDAGDGTAVIVDPRRDTDSYTSLADELGLSIGLVLETHLHADFVSGARELAEGGAELAAAASTDLAVPYRPLAEGDTLAVGAAELRVISTPGHTPEHIAYLLTSDTGAHLFSGGALIRGGAARTDLVSTEATDAMTRAQYASVRRLADLPRGTWLRPTHGAGSFCSAGPLADGAATLSDEATSNPLLRAGSEDEFAELLMGRLGSYPPYFLRLREVNRRGPERLADLPSPRAIPPVEAARLHTTGVALVDVRTVERWSAGSPAGAISNAVRPAFAPWLGWAVPFRQPFLLLADTADEVSEAVRLARRIGYDDIVGWVDGGFDAWREEGLPTTAVELVSPQRAREIVDAGGQFLDVRQAAEVAAGPRLPGAQHLELGEILAGTLPKASTVVTFCGHGERSATAASVLAARGVSVANLAGGTEAWLTDGSPTA